MAKKDGKRYSTRESLARNLKYLLAKNEMSYRELATRTKGAVSAKTVGNMVNEVGAPTIDSVEAIAQVFGLKGWHLIAPDLVDDLNGATSIRHLYETYMQAGAEGRRHIIRVAEREAEYQRLPTGTDDTP
jgi:transcriptional regulator with XRE-family HTH domain